MYIRKRKECPADRYQHQRIDMPEQVRQLLETPQQKQLFQHQQHPKVHAPEDKVPACPVPEARQQPDDGNIAELLCKAALVASQRDIDIIPEPCPHGDMPGPPEIGNTVGKKWKVKICIANQTQAVVSMIQSSLRSAPLLRAP